MLATETERRVRRLLIVEDDPDTAVAIAEMARDPLVAVEICVNGIRAVAQARDMRPDAVVLDVWLPGMDGFEVFRILRDTPGLASTRVIFLTAHAEPGALGLAKDMGAFACMRKPFKADVLGRRIFEALGLADPPAPRAPAPAAARLPAAPPGPGDAALPAEPRSRDGAILVVARPSLREGLVRRVAEASGLQVVAAQSPADVVAQGRARPLRAIVLADVPRGFTAGAFIEHLHAEGVAAPVIQLTDGPAAHPAAAPLQRFFRGGDFARVLADLEERRTRKPAGPPAAPPLSDIIWRG